MTLESFRAEAAGYLGRPPDELAILAWKHDPGCPPEPCALDEAVALSVPRAEYDAARDDDLADQAPSWAATPEPDGGAAEACTLHEVQVVYTLARHALGWSGAVVPSPSGRAWTLYREA